MRRNLKILSLGLVAVLALAAVSAASASASQPEFQTESGKFGVSFEGSDEGGTLETVGERTVTCTGSTTSGGKIETSTTTEGSTITFTGCKASFGVSCKSAGQASGTIVTEKVKGTLVYGKHSTGQVPSVLLEPEEGEIFAVFTCAFTKSTVKGKVLGAITPVGGEFSTSSTLTFTQTGGVQESGTTYYAPSGCAETTATLETKGEGFPSFGYEQSAIEGTTALTSGEGVKIVAGEKCV